MERQILLFSSGRWAPRPEPYARGDVDAKIETRSGAVDWHGEGMTVEDVACGMWQVGSGNRMRKR